MKLNASMFTDPNARAGLQKYYEDMKANTLATLKAREADPSFKATMDAEIKTPDGTVLKSTAHVITAEMAAKSFVSFDTWLEITAQTYDTSSQNFEMAEQRLNTLLAENPDSSSHVRSTWHRPVA
ncbi:hypothetical protein ACQZ46_25560 [Agrobacterium salinitolerans]